MSNAILESIFQVLGNLVQKIYVDENDPWTYILVAAVFEIFSTTSAQKFYSPGQLILGRNMILRIKHRVGWELIRQRNRRKLIEMTTARINIELTINIKLEINPCSLTTLHKNMKHHINTLL